MDTSGWPSEATRRIGACFGQTPRRSVLLGALLLVASTVTVVATANTAPTITSASVTPSMVGEGQTVTVNAAFVDPDAGDAHTVHIRWGAGPKEVIQIPSGQQTIQVSHTYTDNLGPSDKIFLSVRDRQTPVGANQNDNTEKYGEDTTKFSIVVRNLPPSFLRGVAVQKSAKNPRAVTVTGAFADPGTADTHEVRVSWGIEANPFLPIHPCTVTNKQFTCAFTYPNNFSGGYTIRLRVRDDDGDVDNASLQVQLP